MIKTQPNRQVNVSFFENFPEGVAIFNLKLEQLYCNHKSVFNGEQPVHDELLEKLKLFKSKNIASFDEVIQLTRPETTLLTRFVRVKFGRTNGILLMVRDVTADVTLEANMFQRSEELSILYELSAMETEHLNKETIIHQVVGKLSELTALEEAIFVEFKDLGENRIHVLGEESERLHAAELSLLALSHEDCPKHSKVWGNDSSTPLAVGKLLATSSIGICVGIPIVLKEKPTGLLLLFSKEPEVVRVKNNPRFFDMVAKLLGTALERAQLFYELEQSFLEIDRKNRILSEQLELAQKLQRGILEIQFPRKPQIDFAVKYIPSYQLGGDFYDIFETSANRIGVMIADVCGHGVSSALITTYLKAAARDLSQYSEEPAKLLTDLNHKLVPMLPDEMFVSAFYLVIDLETKTALFSNGGHPLPLYYNANEDTVTELDIPGMLLSVSDIAKFETRAVHYSPGDKLFLFTDGLYEIKNSQGQLMGVDKIQSVIYKARKEPVKVIVEEIMEAVYTFANKGDLDDDLNLIGIDLLG